MPVVAGIVTGCGEGLVEEESNNNNHEKNNADDYEPGETGSLGHAPNPFYPVR